MAQLEKSEQKTHVEILRYDGWTTIEQLEDIIGEEKSCDLCHGEVDGKDVHYDLEITFKRVRRSK